MLVSIIIPTYNAANFVTKAIDSIINQTYKNYEIIIVDDGSKDNTREVLKSYIKKDKINYFYKENGGEASARNFGLTKVNGDFITFLDADDIYKPDKLEKQIRAFELNPNIDIVYNDVILIDAVENEIGLLKSEEVIENPKNFLAQMLYRQIIPATATMMLRRKCIENDIRYSEKYSNAVDYSFTIQLAEKFKFYYLPEAVYSYRRHSGNLTNSHLKQVECEKDIVKELGISRLEQIVSETTYSDGEKKILLVKILLKINEYQKALIELNQNEIYNWEYYFIKSVVYYKLGEYANSISALNNSIDYEIRAESFNNLGCCYFQLEDMATAKEYFEQAKMLRNAYNDPINNIDVMKNGGEVKITERQLRKQLTDYNAK